MKIIRHLADYHNSGEKSVLTIGNFDGMHTGHQALLKAVVSEAGETGARPAIITFNRHPLSLLNPQIAPVRISSFKQKIHLLEKIGIGWAVFLRFTRKFAEISAEDFIGKVIHKRFSAAHIVVGSDFAFGKGRRGNVELLKKLGPGYGFQVTVKDMLCQQGNITSSTSVRQLVKDGEMAIAKKMLGRPFSLEGHVAYGTQKGKALKVSTATLRTKADLIPKTGVYAIYAKLNEGFFPGVANIGFQPTFGKNPLEIEAHLFDFSSDIYHQPMELFFLERIRDERAFSSVEVLRQQIQNDIRKAKEICKEQTFMTGLTSPPHDENRLSHPRKAGFHLVCFQGKKR